MTVSVRRPVVPPVEIDSVRLMAVRDGHGGRRNLGVAVTASGQVALVEVELRVVGVFAPAEAAQMAALLRSAGVEALHKD